jgi:geranylgeranyl reductase family protein
MRLPASDPLNLDPAGLPAQCDVLVVGAGPAGSAAAITLARAGVDVVLVDQHPFPRDKVCGDGLIPDAHKALGKLGVLDEVMALAQPSTHVGCIGPRGGRVDVPGTLAVLPRRELDLILCRAAVAAGARMFAPARFVAPLEDDDGRVVGAQLQSLRPDHRGEATQALRARWVVLATGAVPQALLAAGMSSRHTPSGVALRGYVRNEGMAGCIDKLELVWHRSLRHGYGWIFPCRDGVFNIGVGIIDSHGERDGGRLAKKDEFNLRRMFEEFTRIHAPARELVGGGAWTSPLKGAPLRCTLEGAKYSRPGLMVTGEAAGSTYSFSGEGIGKALETGILAAESVVDGRSRALADDAVRARYEAGLLALKPRFDLYARANRVNRHPWLADLLIWRVKKSPKLLWRMSGVLNETTNPGHLVSVKGMLRLFTE